MGVDERDIRDIRDGRDIGAECADSGYVLYLSLHNADTSSAKRRNDFADIARRICRSEERERLQSVADENCVRLAKLRPDRWFPAALRVVVHRGKIVMDKRVVVEKLYRRRRITRVLRLAAYRDCTRQANERTNPLAASADGIAHRLAQLGRALPFLRQNLVERLLDYGKEFFLHSTLPLTLSS